MKEKTGKIIKLIIILLAVPLVVVSGFVFFGDRQYAFVAMVVAILSSLPVFLRFENKQDMSTRQILVLAVMTSLSVLSRFLFAFVPYVKPVTAITVITGVWFGPEMGFMTGAFSALISNFYFGQGPWTPFQMFAWGITGLIAGFLSRYLKANRILLSVYGIFAGLIFSLVMDIWVVVWADGVFNMARYLAALIIGAPVTITYALSNAVFLFLAAKPIGRKLNRIKIKYGI